MTTIPREAAAAGVPEGGRPLGYFKFLLQFISVVIAYFAAQVAVVSPAIVQSVVSGEDPSTEMLSLLSALASPISAAVAVFVAWLWLRRSGRFREAMGLLPITNWPQTIGVAALVTGATIAIFAFGGMAVEALGFASPDISEVLEMVTASPALFTLWIVAVAWLGAGLGEELLWRGFMLDRLSHLRGIGGSMPVALVVQAVIFGLAHLYQGWGGVILTGLIGLLMGWVRLRMKGSIWAAVFAHAAVDTIMLSLGYAGELGWIGN